jgi:hypothetical protein
VRSARIDVDAVAALTRIDPWFLDGVRRMVEAEDAFEGLELASIRARRSARPSGWASRTARWRGG